MTPVKIDGYVRKDNHIISVTLKLMDEEERKRYVTLIESETDHDKCTECGYDGADFKEPSYLLRIDNPLVPALMDMATPIAYCPKCKKEHMYSIAVYSAFPSVVQWVNQLRAAARKQKG